MVGERSRKPWTGDEPVGFDPSTFRQILKWWIRHWCAKRFAKSCAFQQTRVSSNLTSTAKCVGGRAANATACSAVLPCGANTGGSSPSRRTKFLWPADGNWADLQSSNLCASEFESPAGHQTVLCGQRQRRTRMCARSPKGRRGLI
jgi:hypothetical protein